ncbi:MAG: hypothetical protein BZ138_03840 [Methanosphaera sp. rholeuAM270]|nr:MAG: hypothetical protein BZ138_03840 [Methanosphaera sp. rholeuAM270]
MVNKIKYLFAKNAGKLSSYFLKILPTGGQSFPGLVSLKIGGTKTLGDLSKNQIEKGSILITGTNGKTTTTTMLIKLFSNEYDLSSTVGNNTIYSLSTSLLMKKSEFGIFEYGIRDIEHGTPDLICDLVKPIGVIYTNISREHTQVLGIKNPFEKYVEAKSLLSSSMENGVVVTNADDPNTTFIGKNREAKNNVVYYGLELDDFTDIFEENPVNCPNCNNKLDYEVCYLNQRGKYSCTCGFKRPKLNVKLTKYLQNIDSCDVTIEVNLQNYEGKPVQYTLDLNLPLIGLHNIYNCLTCIATYSVFTTNDNIKETLQDFFENYEFIVPPGRFEILKVAGKTIGVGQGDNGDALKVNSLLMKENLGTDLEFIYTTPDENEEEIFEDHFLSIKALNPDKLVVMPGRVSLKASEEYYDQLKDSFDATYYPVDFDFRQRIDKVIELIKDSENDSIIISGCGEEILFWDELKKEIKKMDEH